MRGFTSRKKSGRVRAQVSVMTHVELRDMLSALGLSNRSGAYQLGMSESAIQHYLAGSIPIPLVLERALCFLALRHALLVHDIVFSGDVHKQLDVRAFVARLRGRAADVVRPAAASGAACRWN